MATDNELLAKDRVRCKKLAEENQDLKLQSKVLEKQISSHKNNLKRLNEMNDRNMSNLDKVRKEYKLESEKVASLTQKLSEVKESILSVGDSIDIESIFGERNPDDNTAFNCQVLTGLYT